MFGTEGVIHYVSLTMEVFTFTLELVLQNMQFCLQNNSLL